MAKICALDDEQKFLDLMRLALETVGHEVIAFRDGKEAMFHVSHPRNPPPDIILLDANMPNIDGETFWAFLQQAERTRNIPVILITGNTEVIKTFGDGKNNIAAILEKPFDLNVLRTKVSQILAAKK